MVTGSRVTVYPETPFKEMPFRRAARRSSSREQPEGAAQSSEGYPRGWRTSSPEAARSRGTRRPRGAVPPRVLRLSREPRTLSLNPEPGS